MRKQSLGLIWAIIATAFFISCNETIDNSAACCDTGNPNNPPAFNLSSSGLFPFQNNSNWWKYTASNHPLVIQVLDTISDNHVAYFKVSFAEAVKDTTNNWFRRSSLGTEYSSSLTGSYFIFLPPTFTSRQGSFSLTSGDDVSYSYVDTLIVNGKSRASVMELTFPNRNIHGFDEIDFADGIGIVRMIDNSGRFPVVYALDSARVNGVVYR